MEILALHSQIAAVCPIVGVAVGNLADKTTWRIAFDPAATAPQQQAAQNVVAAFNPNAPTTTDVDVFRDGRLATGFTDATTGKTWQCDINSIARWTAVGSAAGLAIVMATNPAPTFSVWGTDNVPVTLSAQNAFALFNTRVMPWVSATMAYAAR